MMMPASNIRRVIAVLCLVALLFVALTPGGTSASVLAVLVPLWLLIETLVVLSIHRVAKQYQPIPVILASPRIPRAPPNS